MKAQRMHPNRRQEPRYAQSGQKVIWRGERPRTYAGRGTLYDVSVSGLSFLVDRAAPPAVGQAINLYWKSWGEQAAYQVVRVQPHEGATTLVGCRKDPASAGRLHRSPRMDRPEARRASIRPAPTMLVA